MFENIPEDTLLDDFTLSLRIATRGYKIAYRDKAYAIESGSADMHEEQKRKVRIAAGGLQAITRLKDLLNIFKYGLNLLLATMIQDSIMYKVIFILQTIFYLLACLGAILATKQIKIKILFIPYYFIFMNLSVLKAFFYLKKFNGKGTWEKVKR